MTEFLDEYLSEDPGLLPDEDAEGREMFEHFRLVADKGQAPLRVDKYLATHLESTSRHRVQLAIKSGYVLINDKPAKANAIIRPSDVIRFVMPYQRRGVEILPENIPLDIVYEDEDVLVVNKPAGMVVHPGHGNSPAPSSMHLPSISACRRGPTRKTNGWASSSTGSTRIPAACCS